MRNWTYFKLLDRTHKNQVVRADGHFQQHYDNGWIRSGIMMDYFIELSPTHDMYEEISEAEAIEILGEAAIKEPA